MPALSDAEYQNLHKICAAVAYKYLSRAARFRLSLDDLTQDALVGANKTLGGALRAHAQYSEGRGYYSSWIGRAAHAAIIDRLRREERQAAHVADYGRDIDLPTPPPDTFANGGPSNAEILDFIPRRLNRERGTAFAANAYAAAMVYRETHGLSSRALWLRLHLDAALCRLLGFNRPPARSSLLLGFLRVRKWCVAQRPN